MKFKLALGLFDHNIKDCRFFSDTVYIKTVYPIGGERFEERKAKVISGILCFRYENRLYKIPSVSGNYTFYDLHIGKA